MKIMIASDIHGSAKYCAEMLEAFRAEKADRLLLLGDLLYHGPRNALPGKYDTKEVAGMLNDVKDLVLCVRGNCDCEVDQMMLDFPIMAEYCLLFLGGKVIFATHGHVFDKGNFPKAGLLVHGHTHIPAWERLSGGRMYVNPGSVSIPKGGSERGYMTMDEEGMSWKNLAGEVYHTEKL